jgi:multidrug efflux pump
MDFSRYFIDRPIFAAVLSIVIFVAGALAIPSLPLSEYPDVVPPSIGVRAVYPGANPKEIAETVAAPLEEAMNGVENMMYMKSVAGSDGVLWMFVTFHAGTDPDIAQVQVQNRVNQALPRLPEDVRRMGVSADKMSPDLTMVVHLTSPDERYDSVYLRNYATLHMLDEMRRLPGVGQAMVFGAGDYAMRIWIDPDRAAARSLTAGDVLRAVREQNVQVSAGQLGAPPTPQGSDFLVAINAQGRLATEEEFGEIVIRQDDGGRLTRLRDVARLELGASEYALRSLLDNGQAVAIAIFQAPGANAIALSDTVRAKSAELAERFPEGMDYQVVYDPTVFVRDSIRSVVYTLLEAVVLVVLVVTLFLQTWRASLIPLLAVPVSIVGSFAVLYLLGFSINTLTLFALVLSVGIVVDDAIVVVENVERHIAEGLKPLAAAHQAMREVSGPIIAITLVLCAVFVPMAFLEGVTGEFYRQFAVTIAIATVISGFNSLTLSPALAAVLLRSHDAPKDVPTRLIDRGLGWLFRPFNRAFGASSERYQSAVTRTLRRKGAVFAVYALLLAGTGLMFQAVPGGFIPTQDKLYLIGAVKLPEGASLDRTEEAVKRMSELALSTEGVASAVAFPGLNAMHFNNTPNIGTIFFGLADFRERSRSAEEITAELNMKFGAIQEALAFAFQPPAVLGIGTGSGFSLFVQDRAGLGYGELQNAVLGLSGALAQVPGMGYAFSSYQANVPQLDAKVDREKAKAQGVSLTELFETLQVYLGSAYVNDFNRFGRTYQVIAQADAPYRMEAGGIGRLRTRNDAGDMVPIGSMVTLQESYGPDPVIRYNGYPAADLMGEADPRRFSSAQALAVVNAIAPQVLPAGMSFEWTDLSYQQVMQGNTAIYAVLLAVLLAFLVLAALYESWTLPLAIILIVPMCMLAALLGVWATGGDNNLFVQVGLVLLMGLACKNAILIVEFARELEREGRDIVAAALEACRIRLRPIIMTSITFTAAVVPLALATGAGAEIRIAMGVAVFWGMVGVTVFGLFLTPVFYVGLRRLAERLRRTPENTGTAAPEAGHA